MNHHASTLLRRSDREPWGHGSRGRFSLRVRPRGVVLFVHGFRGSAIDTWLAFPFSLPREPKVADFDLLYYGYDTREQAGYSADKLRELLCLVAEDPAALVNPSLPHGVRSREPHAYEHIVIAAHSLGAVVSRLALLLCVDAQHQPLGWLSRVRLALFAPAHSGARAARLASLLLRGVPANGLVEAGARAIYKSIDDVDPGSPTLRDLSTRTATVLGAGVDCHRAWVAHGKKDWVVFQNQFEQDRVPWSRWDQLGHSGVCKPDRRERRPLDFLLDVIP
jgi:hypothetical protein